MELDRPGAILWGRPWTTEVPQHEKNMSVEGVEYQRVGYWQCVGDRQFPIPEVNPFFDAPVRRITFKV